MLLILREIIGWVLLVMGLSTFRVALDYVNERQVVEAGISAFIGFWVFRGGIQLIKGAMLVRAVNPRKETRGWTQRVAAPWANDARPRSLTGRDADQIGTSSLQSPRTGARMG